MLTGKQKLKYFVGLEGLHIQNILRLYLNYVLESNVFATKTKYATIP